ncbi:S10 family peptidase [Novosphingobium sp. 11B]
MISGTRITYRVVAADTEIRNETGVLGSIFSFSYLRRGVDDPRSRPVAFVFNGGPGASSVWLHLGAVGPRRVRLNRDVDPSVLPPYEMEDNPGSPLDIADLVFVDPVGTGFSRLRGKGNAGDFYGVDEDARSIAQFIDRWLSANDRWESPKYIVGESYGTIRAAVLQRMLMGGPDYGGVLHAISINGIALVGAVLEPFSEAPSDQDFAMLLPSYAATAWYHNKIDRAGRRLESFVEEAAAFAGGEYMQLLQASSALTSAERIAGAHRIANLIGLSADLILSEDLRVSTDRFSTTLLLHEKRDLGVYDTRYTLSHARTGLKLDGVADDPAMSQYTPSYVGAWHQYLRGDLKVDIDDVYAAINWTGLSDKWRWERDGVATSRSYAIELALAMRRNPQLKLLVASGYFDLATPMFAAEAALGRANVPMDRTRFTRYASGHMVYLGGTGNDFARDLRALIADA